MKAKKLIVKTTHEMKMAQHRNALIETGMYGHYKEKVIPSKKAYNRKKQKAYLGD